MRISLITAIATNGVIGKGQTIPWKISSDMRYFKGVTLDKPMIMGRKTWESFGGRPLPKRPHIVVTRTVQHITPHETFKDVFWVPDIEHAMLVANQCIKPEYAENPEIFFIGGSEIYREAIPYCNRLYMTNVFAEPEGDVYFPQDAINWQRWGKKTSSVFNASEENQYTSEAVIYERIGRIPKPFLWNENFNRHLVR
jgi:dihydrofolate reductase